MPSNIILNRTSVNVYIDNYIEMNKYENIVFTL